jgi:sec-independent protein translocase protein TatA
MGGWDAPWHWVVLAILVIALFGYKKLPDAARSVGRSLRVFKTEMKGMREDDKARSAQQDSAQQDTSATDQAKQLPQAEVVRRELPANGEARTRPRPSPRPAERAESTTQPE